MRLTATLLLLAACTPGPRAGSGDSASQPPGDTTTPPPQASTGTAPLEGTTWRLVQVGGQPVPVEADSARRPSMRLLADGRKVQGSAGCNRMMGSYTRDDDALKFGPLMTTRMACPAMETEQAFLKALAATTRYEISGAGLTLYGSDGALARLEPASAGDN